MPPVNAAPAELTVENFQKLKYDMNEAEVCRIFGPPSLRVDKGPVKRLMWLRNQRTISLTVDLVHDKLLAAGLEAGIKRLAYLPLNPNFKLSGG